MLVAVLLATELAGVLGALLAIPVAGIIQVVLRDAWDHRRGAPKPEPTVGEDRVPVDTGAHDEHGAGDLPFPDPRAAVFTAGLLPIGGACCGQVERGLDSWSGGRVRSWWSWCPAARLGRPVRR